MSKPAIKIVLAEDEKIIALAYQQGLGHIGFSVVVAADGIEALAAVKKASPDILLLDLIMPNMDGFEVLKTLRGDKKFAKLPIIVVSNLSESSDEARALELGANDYIIKANCSLQELGDRIKKTLA